MTFPNGRPTEETVRLWREYRDAGFSDMLIADKLGISATSLKRAILRAKAKGMIK